MYIVYVLYSNISHKYYVGFTTNLEQRIISHNLLGKDWTRSYRPWTVIHKEEFDNKTKALHREKFLKSGKGREFIKALPH